MKVDIDSVYKILKKEVKNYNVPVVDIYNVIMLSIHTQKQKS